MEAKEKSKSSIYIASYCFPVNKENSLEEMNKLGILFENFKKELIINSFIFDLEDNKNKRLFLILFKIRNTDKKTENLSEILFY